VSFVGIVCIVRGWSARAPVHVYRPIRGRS
jgi:hypothetical protein